MINFLPFKYKVLPNSQSFQLIQQFLCYCISGNKEKKLCSNHTVLPSRNVLYHIVLFYSHQGKCPSLKQVIIKALIFKLLNRILARTKARTNSRHKITMTNKFGMITPYIFGWLLHFWKICAPLLYTKAGNVNTYWKYNLHDQRNRVSFHVMYQLAGNKCNTSNTNHCQIQYL